MTQEVSKRQENEQGVLLTRGTTEIDLQSCHLIFFQPYFCGKPEGCQRRFKRLNEFRTHWNYCGHIFECHLCPLTYLAQNTLKRHFRTKHNQQLHESVFYLFKNVVGENTRYQIAMSAISAM